MKLSALSNGANAIYTDSPSHPSDESRMRAVFMMLNKTGFASECLEISESWEQFLAHTNNPKHPDYKYIFPEELLSALTEIVFDYCRGIDLATYKEQTTNDNNPISKTVNDGWKELHQNPTEFENLQQKMIAGIKNSILGQ